MREIAKKVSRALSTVHEGIEAELAEITAPFAAELHKKREREREIEGARLTLVIKGSIKKATRGDAEASHVVIAAIRQRSKLFGLDAPTRTEHSGPEGGPIMSFDLSKLTDEQIDAIIAGDTSVLEGADPSEPEGAGESGEDSTED